MIEAIELPERRYALGVLWHPEEDVKSSVVGVAGRGVARGGGGGVIEVIEPATETVMAEVPRAGAEEVDAAVAAAKAAFPAWRAVEPGERAGDASQAGGRDRGRGRRAGHDRGAQRRQADRATPAGEIAMVVECFRYYAGAPERLLGQHDPGRRAAST